MELGVGGGRKTRWAETDVFFVTTENTLTTKEITFWMPKVLAKMSSGQFVALDSLFPYVSCSHLY